MRRDPTDSALAARVRIIAVVGIAFAVLICIAALQGLPTFGPAPALEPAPLPSQEQPTQFPAEAGAPAEQEPNLWFGLIASIIGIAIAGVFAFLLIRALSNVARDWWRNRPLAKIAGIEPDVEAGAMIAEQPIAAPIVRRGIASALEAIDTHAAPTDAIIAAWVGLEESAERAGQSRGLSETAAEFTIRIIETRRSSAQAIRSLLRLYENVRFGGAVAEEADRAAARALLQQIAEHWR